MSGTEDPKKGLRLREGRAKKAVIDFSMTASRINRLSSELSFDANRFF